MFVVAGLSAASPARAQPVHGQVLGGGAPIDSSTVTLWAATAGAPKELGQAHTGADGRFSIKRTGAPSKDAILYLLAKGGQSTANRAAGDNPGIALMAVLGDKPPARVTVNEFTTVASVWTNAQFLDGVTLKGHPLGLRIAAGKCAQLRRSGNRRMG